MAYATVADLVAAFGEVEIIQLTDRAGLGTVDDAVAQEALDRASSEADSYLEARYPVPLGSAPKALVATVCDIARYRLSGGDSPETDPIASRYKLAVAWLRDISRGLASLPGAAAPVSTNRVAFDSGRRSMAGWPRGDCDE